MAADVVTVAEEWVYQTLIANPGVTAIFGAPPNTRVWPAFAPREAMLPYLTHDLAGAGQATPLGMRPPSQYSLIWQVTVWGDGQSRQQLRAGVKAWLAALLGETMGGVSTSFLSVADSSAWAVNALYLGPIPVPGGSEAGGDGIFQRVAHGIKLEMQAL